MARAQRKRQGPRAYYRCARCQSLIPLGYETCGSCGYRAADDWQRSFIDRAKRTFPGAREE